MMLLKWIHPSLRQRKDQRLAVGTQGERGQERRIWTMVSNPRTLVQWWMLWFNKQSFWDGKRGGASCWQCQGPYQLVSASATETNDWATAFLCVYDRQKHSRGPHHIYIYIYPCVRMVSIASSILLTVYWWHYDLQVWIPSKRREAGSEEDVVSHVFLLSSDNLHSKSMLGDMSTQQTSPMHLKCKK